MKIIDRIFEYLDYKQIKPTAFEKKIGLSNGYLGVQKKRKADIGEGIILKLIDNCQDLSIDWLLTGRGEMLVSKEHVPDYNRPKMPPDIASDITATEGAGPQVPASDKRNEDFIEIIKDMQKIIAAQQRTIGELSGTINILAKRGDAGTVTGAVSLAASE